MKKGSIGKDKGNAIKGAGWTCNEIGHRAEDCPKKKPNMNQVGEAHEEDHSWEDEEEFGEETVWTGEYLASLQAAQVPPALPTPIKNCWNLIAPDNDEDYEPNDVPSGPITSSIIARDKTNFPLPTSTVQSQRGKNMSSTYSTSGSTPYSLIIGCMLLYIKPGDEQQPPGKSDAFFFDYDALGLGDEAFSNALDFDLHLASESFNATEYATETIAMNDTDAILERDNHRIDISEFKPCPEIAEKKGAGPAEGLPVTEYVIEINAMDDIGEFKPCPGTQRVVEKQGAGSSMAQGPSYSIGVVNPGHACRVLLKLKADASACTYGAPPNLVQEGLIWVDVPPSVQL